MQVKRLTVGNLFILLQRFDIPVENWGTGEAKDLVNYLKEIGEGESYLRIDHTGISRVVEIVKMHFKSPQPEKKVILKEIRQTLPDGRKRERNQEPAGKIKLGETPDEALKREIREELKLEPADYTHKALPTRIESRPSKSYPGISCLYIIHPFEIVPNLGTQVLRPWFETTQEDGTILYFEWVPEE
ncbi:MAG: NUDIX domain-containing protein [bacterium]